jgi:hypothetical protein
MACAFLMFLDWRNSLRVARPRVQGRNRHVTGHSILGAGRGYPRAFTRAEGKQPARIVPRSSVIGKRCRNTG